MKSCFPEHLNNSSWGTFLGTSNNQSFRVTLQYHYCTLLTTRIVLNSFLINHSDSCVQYSSCNMATQWNHKPCSSSFYGKAWVIQCFWYIVPNDPCGKEIIQTKEISYTDTTANGNAVCSFTSPPPPPLFFSSLVSREIVVLQSWAGIQKTLLPLTL